MSNRLAAATSPYLQQHADNPVHWWEWSPEAFAEARERDLPILLSVGYAACHWCHVMAHESFEDAATADFMNRHFVNIKVDREERPDVDALYMQATQAMSGHGGWPMTCVLTPDGEPFFAGTYFPPEPRSGQPAFTQVLQALADAWRERRDDVLRVGRDVAEHLQGAAAGAAGETISAADLEAAAAALGRAYDAEAGGFGASPKFPPSMVLEFLLRYADRTGSADALTMVRGTVHAMVRGGIYDQLGGGFARYAVDRFWRLPHFEKMLYDNALLLRVLLHLDRATDDALARRAARETADFLLAELRTPEGGFASALDADSDGHEGTYYVWDRPMLQAALGADDAAWAAELLEVTAIGTFERGLSTLQLLADPDDAERWSRVRETLRQARAQRTRPARDDKVISAWNGWAITALVEAGVLLDEPRYTAAAIEAADLIHRVHLVDGQLRRTSRDGVVGRHAGVLEDHAAVAEAYLAVLGATGDLTWWHRAEPLLERIVTDFTHPDGGFVDTAQTDLLVAPRDPSDNAYPSGSSAAATALLAAAAISGDHRWRAAAEAAVASAVDVARSSPRFAGQSLAVAEALLAGPLEIAIVGFAVERTELQRAALRLTSPGAVVVAGEPGLDLPLFADRELIGGQAAAYVCRGFVCGLPVTNPAQLASASGSGTPAG